MQVSCASSDQEPSIAGSHGLTRVDDRALPCCGMVDSSGARVTTVSASITLGAAASEAFTATPARRDFADGSSSISTSTSVGKYAWSDGQQMIALVGAHLSGSITRQNTGAVLEVRRTTFTDTDGPMYTFAPAP
jgi:hypothetical protein